VENKMLLELLLNTPLYVYWIFFSLLFVGLSQTKTRHVGLKRAVIIPFILIIASVYAIIHDFGISLFSTTIWIAGIVFVAALNKVVQNQREVIYIKEKKLFTIGGSFLPLFMMMLLFFTKYTVGVINANEMPLLHTSLFIAVVSLLYGVFSGMYLIRFVVLIQKIKN